MCKGIGECRAITLTAGADAKTGGAGNDVFDASFTAGGAQTLNTGDSLVGGEGTDTLTVEMKASVTPAMLSSIEVVNVTDTTGGNTLNLVNAADLTTLNLQANAGGAFNASNIRATSVAVSVSDTTQNHTIGYAAAAVAGAADAATINVTNVTGAADIKVDGVETLTINTAGSASSIDVDATAATTLNITGSADLTVGDLAVATSTAIAKVDATNFTGDLNLTLGNQDATVTPTISVTGGSGDDTLDVSAYTGKLSLNAGAGNDTVTVGTNATAADTLNGGDGDADVLVTDNTQANILDGATPTTTNVSNFEQLTVTDELNGTLVLANIASTLNTVNLTYTNSNNSQLMTGGDGITGLAGSLTVNLGGSSAGNDSSVLAGALTLTDTGTATNDSVTLVNKAVNSTTNAKLDVFAGQNVTSTGYENVTIDGGASKTTNAEQDIGTLTVTADDASANVSVTLKGAAPVHIDTKVTTNSTGLLTIDASQLTAQATGTNTLTIDLTESGAGGTQSITGSAGEDRIDIGNFAATISGGAMNDTINGGSGNDSISGGDGNDTIDSGDGNNTVDGGAGNDAITAGAGVDSLLGGDGDDVFYFGAGELTNSDTVDGGAGTNSLSVAIGSLPGNAAFANVTNVQRVELTGGGTVSLSAPLSVAATFDLDDGQATAEGITFATGYTGATTVLVNDGDDVINTAGVALTVKAESSNLSANNTITGGSGVDTLILTAQNGTSTITNVTKIENLTILANGTTAGHDATVTLNTNDISTAGTTLTIDASNLTSADAVFTLNAGGLINNATKVVVTGGAGNDIIKATTNGTDSSSAFSVEGGLGKDSIIGGAGNDTLNGGAGNDTIMGGTGNDSIAGDAGDDSIEGAAGNDNITAGDGNDTLDFDSNDLTTADNIDGGAGTNTLEITANGGAALADADFTNVNNFQKLKATGVAINATLGSEAAAAGIVTITDTNGQNDTVTFASGFTNSVAIALDSGNDTYDATNAAATLTLSVAASQNVDVNDLLVGGTGSSDKIKFTANSDATGAALTNAGNAGWETIEIVADGSKYIKIATGESMVANGGTLVVNASALTDNAAYLHFTATETGTGIYSVTGGAGNDNVTTGSGADILSLGEGDNTVSGGAGNDTITTGSGNDSVDGGAGNNTITAGAGNNTISATTGNNTITTTGSGTNTITVTSGTNNITTGDGDDTITVGAGANTINAGAGNNTVTATGASDKAQSITTGAGNDVVTGGAGNDTINVGDGANNVIGGAGADSIVAGAGNDTIQGGDGADTLTGGAGNDVFVYLDLATQDESEATDSATPAFDTITDFDFSKDKFMIDSTSYGVLSSITNVTIASADLATFNTTLDANASLATAFAGDDVDAVLLTVSTGTAAGTYVLIEGNDGSDGDYEANNSVVIKLTNATNTDQFSAANFTTEPSTTVSTNVDFTGTAANETMNLTYVASGYTATANGMGGSNTLKVKDTANISGATITNFTNLTFEAADAGTADLTMNAAQHAAFTGTITAAGTGGSGEKITLTDAFTGTGFADVENYVLANATNSFTLGAAGQNVTGDAGADTIVVGAGVTATGTLALAGGTNHISLGAGAGLNGTVTAVAGTYDITLTGATASMKSAIHGANSIVAAGTETITFLDAAASITLDADVETYVLGGSTTNSVTLGATGQSVTGVAAANDTVVVAGQTLTASSVLNGGAGGTDVLQLDTGSNISLATVSNFENLTVTSGASVTMTTAQYDALDNGTVTGVGSEQITLGGTAGGAVALKSAIETYVISDTGSNTVSVTLANAATNAADSVAVNISATGGNDVLAITNTSVINTDTAVITVTNFVGGNGATRDQLQLSVGAEAQNAGFQGATTAATVGGKNTIVEVASGTAVLSSTDLTGGGTVETAIATAIGDTQALSNNDAFTIIFYSSTNGTTADAYIYNVKVTTVDLDLDAADMDVELVGVLSAVGADNLSVANFI